MTENIAVYNDDSLLPIEDLLENVLGRYGADVIPLEALSFDWQRINNLAILSLKEFEQWVPRLRWFESPKTRIFQMPDDCQEVRAVMLNTPGVIDTDMPVLYPGRDYTYNKYQNIINSYLTGLKVQYLGTYLLKEYTKTTDEEYIVQNVETSFKIKYVPKPGTVNIVFNGVEEQLTPTKVAQDFQEYTFSNGTVCINLALMQVSIISNISGNIQLNYTCKYKGISGITQGEEFFEAMFAEKLLTSISNIKAVCNFSTMPINITSDSLATLASTLHTEVQDYCSANSRQKWWLGITAIS